MIKYFFYKIYLYKWIYTNIAKFAYKFPQGLSSNPVHMHCYSDSLEHANELCEHWPNLRIGFTGSNKNRDFIHHSKLRIGTLATGTQQWWLATGLASGASTSMGVHVSGAGTFPGADRTPGACLLLFRLRRLRVLRRTNQVSSISQ